MAMMVCRVTPTRSASSACVISPFANRSARIELVILVGLTKARSPAGSRMIFAIDEASAARTNARYSALAIQK